MKKTTLLLFLLIFGASVAYVTAQNQPAEQPTTPSKEEPYQQVPATDEQKTTQVTGIVDKIDHDKKTFTLKDEVTKESKDYTFTDSTSFSKEDKVMKSKDLKKGDKIRLDLDSQNMVVKIHWEPLTPVETEKPEKQD